MRPASRIRSVEIMLIPGLLQTPDYARYRALEAVRLHSTAAEQVDETVVARIRRQEVLYDTSKTSSSSSARPPSAICCARRR